MLKLNFRLPDHVEGIYRAGLTVILCKACLQDWPWLASENLDLGKVLLILTGKSGSLYMSNLTYTEHLLSLWEYAILVRTRQTVPNVMSPQ